MRDSKCWNRFCNPLKQYIEQKTTPAKDSEFNDAAFIYIFVSGIMTCIILVALFILCRWLSSKSNRMPVQKISTTCSEISVSNEPEFDSVTLNTTV